MNTPYTISDALAGSISDLLEQPGGQLPHAKLLYMVYGYDQETCKHCWDALHARWGEDILLASIEQLPGTNTEAYPSGAHTVIHFRNISSLPVVCFHNGEFEGYNTSFGKIERIGNHVTGGFASALLRWLTSNPSQMTDPQRQAISAALGANALTEMLQHLFDTVRPRLEQVVTYCNALALISPLTLSSWGELLHLLGLFRDPEVFKSSPSFRRSLNENLTLSQVGHWQRETNEHIRNSSILDHHTKAILLGVLADPSRLAQARRELTLDEIRSLVARSRRSAEKIAQTMIIEDLQQEPLNRGYPLSDEEVQALAVQVLESFRNQEQQLLASGGPPAGEGTSPEYLQQVKSNLRRETTAAIHKALAQQSPIIATNIFLGILRCLLSWKEEQEESKDDQKRHGQVRGAHPQQLRVEKMTVQGVQLLPNPSPEKWATLVGKIDLQIREQWKELFADTKLALRTERTEANRLVGAEPLQTREYYSQSKKKKKKKGLNEYATNRAQADQKGEETEVAEMMTGGDPLLEQLHDLENGEPKFLEVAVQVVGSATGGTRISNRVSSTFHLEYDLVEALFLQHLVGLLPAPSSTVKKTKAAPSTQQSLSERGADDTNEKPHEHISYQGTAWTCSSETAIGTDIGSLGFALLRQELHLQVTVPQVGHLDTPGVPELVKAFTEITEPMRERDEGVGYFSTLLLPTLPVFLNSYIRLLFAARQTKQDLFNRLYAPWISSLFTLDLSRVQGMRLTHIVTPFHPLQLRWRQTYEQLLMGHIEQCSAQPSTLTTDFVEELENLSSGNVPGVLTMPPARRSTGVSHHDITPSGEATQGENEVLRSALSYPSTESRTGLFSGYKATLPRLQKLPSLLIRKIEQFLRIYPSAIDRIQISVISPGDLAIEQSLSQMFEIVQRRYSNAGFFTRIFVPDGSATALPTLKSSHRRYDEEQGDLRARTRYHLFPRAEFVTLRQELLKSKEGQRFLFGDSSHPTQHLFLLLDQLGVSVQTHEIPPDAKDILDAFAVKHASSQAVVGADALPDLSVLLHQGVETFDEQTQFWTRGVVDPRDAFSLLYYVIAARSQGHPDSLYRYICDLGRFHAGEFGSDTLIKTLHEHGIWVAIVDRAITREFFGVSAPHTDSSLVLIDFHKGIGPQREYNLTISSTWTQRVRENVEMTLTQIANASQIDTGLLRQPGLATAVLRQFQNISGGLALQLAATDANTKGLLGLLVTAFEISREGSWRGRGPDNTASKRSYTTVIPLDDHNDWFEREEIRTDLLLIHFEVDEQPRSIHLYFTCIECKFDESIQRASKGIRQLKETAHRLQKRFSSSSPEYSFRLRDLVEAIRSLAAIYRDQLPESALECLWTNGPGLHLHLDENEISFYLALYQIQDQSAEVEEMCNQHGYHLLSNERNPFQQMSSIRGERVCVYRSDRRVGLAFEQFIQWIGDDKTSH